MASATVFAALPEPTVTVTTDASDYGVCALVPAARLALTYQFRAFKCREICAFKNGAPSTSTTANSSPALSRCEYYSNRRNSSTPTSESTTHRPSHMASRNPRAQVLARLLSLWEHKFGLRLPAFHTRGVDNTAVDESPRRWSSLRYEETFHMPNHGWTQTPTVASTAELENEWHDISASTRLQIPCLPATPRRSSTASGGQLVGVSWNFFDNTPHQIQLLSEFIIDGALHAFGSNQPTTNHIVKANLFGIAHFV
ncbi:unnamed protein product [Phytophthora lilii]|uniref:Unnamed protein product n=1 Tax=Phytophthora lilii TaxID=2077276 RepID=A0A9W6XI97_9STRA|nr:unnamed protein product [Phytophthora lilii]